MLPVNWIAAYNYLFSALSSENKTLYVDGATFCRMVQQVDPESPSYLQLIPQIHVSVCPSHALSGSTHSLHKLQQFHKKRMPA